ncbi:MAG TPA: CopD family protein [Gammaproteobacteria bacterium]|jgi:putative membrane protein|nr:CopD family protein [Gammaproteobacteria bacterium]
MLWLKALHIIFMVTWFSGLFYLPRLYVYHAMSDDAISLARFKLMERKLYFGITTPGAVLTVFFGGWLFLLNWQVYLKLPWMHAKIASVLLLIVYHIYLGKCLFVFKHNKNTHSHVFYRILNEAPVLFLIGIVLLVILKPSF